MEELPGMKQHGSLLNSFFYNGFHVNGWRRYMKTY